MRGSIATALCATWLASGCFFAVGEHNDGDVALDAGVLGPVEDAGPDAGNIGGLNGTSDGGLSDGGPDGTDDAGLPDSGPDGTDDGGPDGTSDGGGGTVCTIDGQSYARRAQNPANRAECCNPVLNGTGWTPLFSQGASYQRSPNGISGFGVVRDLDGDGLLDVLIGGEAFGVDVYLGLPDGGLAGPIQSTINVSSGVSGVLAGHFRSGGGLDLLLSFGNSKQLALLVNQGGGKFGGEMDFPVGANGYFAPVAADFNGDGWPDVAWGRIDGMIGVLFNLGQGDGQFGNEAVLDPGLPIDIRGLASGDFDGDGVMDLAASSVALMTGEGEVPIFLGIGDGGFQAALLNPSIANPWQIGAGNLAGGLFDDLALGSGDQDSAFVIDKASGLNAVVTYPNGGVSGGVLAIADIDGDGAKDIVQGGEGLLVVLFNRGDGTFWPPAEIPISITGFQDFIVGDLNSDGAIDVAWMPNSGPWTAFLNGCP